MWSIRIQTAVRGLKTFCISPFQQTLATSQEIDFLALPLTIATLALCLPLSFTAHAVEVAQVPGTNIPSQPNLPPIPPPQDVVPIPPPQQPQVPTPSPPPENLLTPPSQQPQEEFPTAVPEKFFVTKFEFVGGTVFKDEELLQTIEKALIAGGDRRFLCPDLLSSEDKLRVELSSQSDVKFPCQKLPRTEKDAPVELTFAQLLQARSAITQFYIDKEYITSGALIPEQTLPPGGGAVKIQLVEGTLEDIKVVGTRRLNRNYISSRLARARQKPLKRDRLLEALQLLQLNPLIDSLNAELSAGSRFGSNLLLVKVKEAQSLHGSLRFDNNRSPSVGSFQRTAQLREDNLLGIGDGISLSYANTDGSDEINFSYTIPVSPQNTTLNFTYSNTSNNVIEEPFDVLKISSNSNEYQLSVRHPVIQNPRQELAVGLTASHRQTQTSLEFRDSDGNKIGNFALSPGADSEGRTRVSALRFFQEWTQRGDRSVLALRSQFSLGIDALDATINKVSPDARFFAWRGQAQWVRSLAKDTLLVIRGDVQLSDRRLLSLEQFGLGGQASVRGYRQDALLTDNGAFGSIELRLPILRIPESQGLLQFIPFVDIGTVWNNFEGADLNPNTLVSTGFGLRFQLGGNLDARFDWGIPLVSVNSNDRTLQENGLYFSVIWNPL
ncbi:MAG: ShlB/FhaC/HecB family hemolysin secretion/activation protein [Heteroscytonema crispum UTEX LB 1556]